MVQERIIWWNKLKSITHPHKPLIPFFTSVADIKKEYERLSKQPKKREKSRKQQMKEAGLFFV